MKKMMVVVLLLLVGLVVACGAQPVPTATPVQAAPGMPNPASKLCVDQGYQLEIRDEAGGQVGYCLFPDGSECEEWAFYRNECAPQTSGAEGAAQPTAAQIANPASTFCVDQGYQLEIRDEAGGQVGYCLFPDGSECEEWAFYRNECAPQTSGAEGAAQPTAAQIANPASENCIQQGGTVTIETRGDGGQYGICLFEDNLQCEEWALLRGDCPAGGVKITGYVTPAAVYCAITGGTYAVTGNSNTDDEQGTCTFTNGVVCDAWDVWNGKCSASAAVPSNLDLGGGANQLVFDSTRGGAYRDLYQVYSGGSDATRLTEGEADSIAGPYSPDGTRIVYTAFGLTASDITVINADGSGQVNLTNSPDIDEGFPDWSPDGAKIAFTTRRDGNNEIYLMDADGANPVRLTDNPGDDFAPSWSPDGTRIAFVSDRNREPGNYDLYIMNADGSGVTSLTYDPAGVASYYSPDWSPDGKRIACRAQIPDIPSEIFVIGVDGTGVKNLTNTSSDEWAPTWSPDGTTIAFQSNADGNWEIYLMPADGAQLGLTNLTQDPADDQMPYWRP